MFALFEKNVNTQDSKSTADRTEGTIRFEKNVNTQGSKSITYILHIP